MVKQVKLKRDVKGYTIVIDLGAVAEMLKLSSDQIASQATIDVKLELKVCNNGKKVIISNKPQKTAEPNPALIAALNSAHEIKKNIWPQTHLRFPRLAPTSKWMLGKFGEH